MAENVLAREVIELATKGLAKVEKDIDGIRRRLATADRQGVAWGRTMERVGRVVQRAFFVAGLGVAGFVRSGLQGTKEGDRLSHAFRRLGQQIAGVFLPSIEKGTRFVERLTAKFAALDGAQQAAIRRMAESGAAALLVGSALGKVNPALGATAAGFTFAAGNSQILRSALMEIGVDLLDLSGTFAKFEKQLGLWLTRDIQRVKQLAASFNQLGQALPEPLARGLQAALTGNIGFLGGLQKHALAPARNEAEAMRRDVTPTAGPAPGTQSRGFEDIADTFKRLQLGALRGEQDKADKANALLQKILDALERRNVAAVGGGLAAVGP